ncbi:MAG: hypothetical protein GKR89_01695 [Candidatus Latescibacteria bacterium]|nr:hypothetical protein [Candidatus Latescibacterota bacterium]
MDIPPDKTQQLRQYAWDYFHLHSTQRMSVFNFFTFLAALMTTGLVTTFGPNFQAHSLGIALGALLSLIAFVFWKLDQRTRFLIKNAEEALKELEGSIGGEQDQPHPATLFRYEEHRTSAARRAQSIWPWRRQLSYGKSLNLVFLLFGLFGLIGAAISAGLQFSLV